MPIALIAVAAVAAAGAAGSAAAKQDAKRKALNAQKDAIKQEQDIDIEKEKTLVADQDRQHYLQTQQFFREQNPDLAAARDASFKTLASAAQAGTSREDAILAQMTQEGTAIRPEDQLSQDLVAQASKNLALGTSLPPEYQAELIKAGLEQGGMSGIGANRQGPVTQRLGRLIGSAGLQLEAQRQQQAAEAASLAESVKAQRQNILRGIVDTSQRLGTYKLGMAGAVNELAQENTPNIGLAGRDVMSLDLTNLFAKNKRLRELANIQSQKELNQGEANAAYIGAGTEFAKSVGSAYGGGGAGGAGGSSGGGGGWSSMLSGLFSRGGGGGGISYGSNVGAGSGYGPN